MSQNPSISSQRKGKLGNRLRRNRRCQRAQTPHNIHPYPSPTGPESAVQARN